MLLPATSVGIGSAFGTKRRIVVLQQTERTGVPVKQREDVLAYRKCMATSMRPLTRVECRQLRSYRLLLLIIEHRFSRDRVRTAARR